MYEQDSDILTVEEETDEALPSQSQSNEFQQNSQSQEQTTDLSKQSTNFDSGHKGTFAQQNLFDATDTKAQTQSPVQKKETTAFVNSSYSTNNLSRTYKTYDVIQTYVPQKKEKQSASKEFETFVTEQSSFSPERETIVVEKIEQKQKPTYKLNSKAKVWLVAIVAIFVMLGGLAIYNAVHISDLQNSIQTTQTDIKDANDALKKATKTLDKITNQDNVMDKATDDQQMHEATDAEKVTIELEPKNQIEDYQGQSNFFDEICDFVRKLFGGN